MDNTYFGKGRNGDFEDLENRDSRVNSAIKREIIRKEKDLGRTCRKKWVFQNPKGETFMFAHFCKNWKKLIVTIAYWDPNIRTFRPCYS